MAQWVKWLTITLSGSWRDPAVPTLGWLDKGHSRLCKLRRRPGLAGSW